MTKYAGLVGYVTQEESPPDSGIWLNKTVEVKMHGDIVTKSHSYAASDGVNDDITLQNRISLVGSPYAYSNFMTMKYVTWMGVKWKITDVEVQRPRLIVSLGGVWNG